MHVQLEIATGPDAGRKITLRSGDSRQVGRGSHADVTIYHDSQIAGAHFELKCDRQTCRLRDIPGSGGTLVNGQKVQDTLLQDGAIIRAGQTDFVVRIVADPAAPAPALAMPVTGSQRQTTTPDIEQALPPTAARERVLQILRKEPEPLFAVLDAARDPVILALLRSCKEEHQSLYEGPKGEQLGACAPYLVRLDPQGSFLETLVQDGWGKSWGVFLTSPQPFKEVRKHLRRFLEVKLPDAKEVYFRYYDPRVLRVYLPTCTRDEWRAFAGPITSYFVEGDKPEVLLRFIASGASQPVPVTVAV
jgi:hypothetical protein